MSCSIKMYYSKICPSTFSLFPNMPCMKKITKTKRRRSTGQQPGNKSASRLALKPDINRLSTADFDPAFGLHRISLVRASGETFRRRVFDALEGTRDTCLLGEIVCWHPVLFEPLPPLHRTPRPDPPVVGPCFRLDRLVTDFLV